MDCVKPYAKAQSPYIKRNSPFSQAPAPYARQANPFAAVADPYACYQLNILLLEDGSHLLLESGETISL